MFTPAWQVICCRGIHNWCRARLGWTSSAGSSPLYQNLTSTLLASSRSLPLGSSCFYQGLLFTSLSPCLALLFLTFCHRRRQLVLKTFFQFKDPLDRIREPPHSLLICFHGSETPVTETAATRRPSRNRGLRRKGQEVQRCLFFPSAQNKMRTF